MKKEDLKKTAKLARLNLSDKEEEAFAGQLKVVFAYFNQISRIDTSHTAPLVYPLEGISADSSLRADKAQKPQNPEELLSLAPERLGQEYKVPPVVE